MNISMVSPVESRGSGALFPGVAGQLIHDARSGLLSMGCCSKVHEEINGLVGDLVGDLMAGDFMDSEWAWGVISWNG